MRFGLKNKLASAGLIGALALGQMMTGGTASATHGGTGNGAPNGGHYTLNIIGVPKGKIADMTGSNGHRIFVKLDGKTSIWLCESGVDAGCADVDGFQVLDANGTDGNGAMFALPNPDPDGDGTTVYSVFARPLGTPGGKSFTTTCAAGPDGILGDDPGTVVDESLDDTCSVIILKLERDAAPSKFTNVSKYLLYIYADYDLDGDLDRLALFDSRLENYVWSYDNQGLRLAQLRFYQCETIVPGLVDVDGDGDIDAVDIELAESIHTACFSGTH